MKYLDSHFEDYLKNENSLHPDLLKKYSKFPKNVEDLKNVIFYGPSGVGKYTQMLNCISKYSQSKLKYEKKMSIEYNKVNYNFKISDIHFEIDMALLGCNSKLLWNDIYNNIIDVLSARPNKNGIIVCKNFHKIHNELLDSFYSYIQENFTNINIIYIFITEHISFIPDNILNTFNVISVSRPSKTYYNRILNKKLPTKFNVTSISNIKNVLANTSSIEDNNIIYINNLYNMMIDLSTFKYTVFRNTIYDMFIYDIDVTYIIWNVLKRLREKKLLDEDKYTDLLLATFNFFQYYNNNYRPIYHLEKYLYNIIIKVHEF